MITDEQRKALAEPLPRSEVRTREGGGGKALSYVEGWWVIHQMNLIFGSGGWSYDASDTRETVRIQRPDGRWEVAYSARCRLVVGECTIADVGHGNGLDKSCGAAIEKAEKEAATDALKRCAKSLGMRLGLALYDKEQEYVQEEAPPPKAEVDRAVTALTASTWRTMSDAELRAAWPKLSPELRAEIKAARAAKGGA